MANYTNMVKSNHDRSEAMLNLSLTTISEMVENGEIQVKHVSFGRPVLYVE